MKYTLPILALMLLFACDEGGPSDDNDPFVYPDAQVTEFQDMLQPAYYLADSTDSFRVEVNRFVYHAREIGFVHPLGDSTARPDYVVPELGCFGAGKGPSGTEEHHPANDMHIGHHDTLVTVYAPHNGIAHTYRDAPKYRHYLSITRDVLDSDSIAVGKLVTILGHIDLDFDEGDSLFMDGMYVEQGDIVSRHLWSGTTGGPHLHWEIRYYRPDGTGTESFYGISPPWGDESFTTQSEGLWDYGFWNPDIGYGFGRAENHGVSFE